MDNLTLCFQLQLIKFLSVAVMHTVKYCHSKNLMQNKQTNKIVYDSACYGVNMLRDITPLT